MIGGARRPDRRAASVLRPRDHRPQRRRRDARLPRGLRFFDADGFHTRQFFLSGYEAERELLDALAALAERFNGLVTFNGRTFDVPLIETRYLFHRLESPFADMPHFDMLHPARKLWRRRSIAQPSHRERWSGGRPGDAASCALGALEEAILGVQRFDDVPGFEIPSRYFNYLRTGDVAPLAAVFEHNRLDLLSLAALTAIAAVWPARGRRRSVSPRSARDGTDLRAPRTVGRGRCVFRARGRLGESPWDARIDRSRDQGACAEASCPREASPAPL